MSKRKIRNALISVFHKDGLESIINLLHTLDIKIYSTGGTYDFIASKGIPVDSVESLTQYPSIFGGRVKTLHPMVFGGILNRRSNESDENEKKEFGIPDIDLVIVDLYPFEKTVADKQSSESDIIEKIDIGGISLIRAAAKNFQDVVIIPSVDQYDDLERILKNDEGTTDLETRKYLAAQAFNISSHYDTAIFGYLNGEGQVDAFKKGYQSMKTLRYGENPHQKGSFFGDLGEYFDQLHGKEISYNNLVDIEAGIQLISEFAEQESTFAILKHNNACGIAQGSDIQEAYKRALEADPISAFGGILVANQTIDAATAETINSLFYEVIIAPDFDDEAMKVLQSKKNRIILKLHKYFDETTQFKSMLNGVIVQDYNRETDSVEDIKQVTKKPASASEIQELLFASKICKHTKSNTIVLTKNRQMLASGVGQTSRVDALEQAISKAKKFNFELQGSVMASDAFFPFPDCVEIASGEGISAVIQPGGSVKDQLSIDYCDAHDMAMIFSGRRHFKH